LLPLFPLTYTVWVHPGQPAVFGAISDAFLRQRPVEQMGASPMPSSGYPIGDMLLGGWVAGYGLIQEPKQP